VTGQAGAYGHVICAIPETTLIIEFICDMGVLGSAGAVASIVTIPVNPLHCATPLAVMVGVLEGDIDIDMGMGVGDMKGGFPTLQSTGCDITGVGAMLNVAVAVN
jgi:hypothetical protein